MLPALTLFAFILFPLFFSQPGKSPTYFTCPSRQAQGEPEGAPIGVLCGNGGEAFAGTFNCDQAPGDLPKPADCGAIDTVVFDNLIRPMSLIVPPQSGIAVSLLNNTCAIVFLNDDGHDTYQTCLDEVVQILDDLSEFGRCPGPLRNGFVGSVRSPIQPGVQNWEVRIASSKFFNQLVRRAVYHATLQSVLFRLLLLCAFIHSWIYTASHCDSPLAEIIWFTIPPVH
ncbi:hypothetical protein B0H19DRAFT_1080348 [Mycena capillaripes]|nr:hypothetical protein B0H19DRAFT_1080348 [Mycena capillaripes]